MVEFKKYCSMCPPPNTASRLSQHRLSQHRLSQHRLSQHRLGQQHIKKNCWSRAADGLLF